jgi:hypothetical protein
MYQNELINSFKKKRGIYIFLGCWNDYNNNKNINEDEDDNNNKSKKKRFLNVCSFSYRNDSLDLILFRICGPFF